eukprot:TRINITY_DN52320_c0_g1_i1.p1 TRINITY_DN52320_c0_g1~~TRINITY_DN52320_c0_g1_i1.p1  ORF type:complete len:153 (+),score=31.51 TRINITY_DN52320_c0_g1_i1:118-576(+)
MSGVHSQQAAASRSMPRSMAWWSEEAAKKPFYKRSSIGSDNTTTPLPASGPADPEKKDMPSECDARALIDQGRSNSKQGTSEQMKKISSAPEPVPHVECSHDLMATLLFAPPPAPRMGCSVDLERLCSCNAPISKLMCTEADTSMFETYKPS